MCIYIYAGRHAPAPERLRQDASPEEARRRRAIGACASNIPYS